MVHWVNSVPGLAFGMFIKHEGTFILNQYNGLMEPTFHNFIQPPAWARRKYIFIPSRELDICRLCPFLHKYQKLSSGRSDVSSEWTSNTKNCLSKIPGYVLVSYTSWCPQKHAFPSKAAICLSCNLFYESFGLYKAFRYTLLFSIYLCLGNSKGWCRGEDDREGKSHLSLLLCKSRGVYLTWSMNVKLIFCISDWRNRPPAGYSLSCACSGVRQSGINLLTLALWWRDMPWRERERESLNFGFLHL